MFRMHLQCTVHATITLDPNVPNTQLSIPPPKKKYITYTRGEPRGLNLVRIYNCFVLDISLLSAQGGGNLCFFIM